MALIIVDGYNFIGRRGGLRGDIEGKRNSLIRELGKYSKIKGHLITVVFDGWRSGYRIEMKEEIDGITVIFSKRGETADTVIKNLSSKKKNRCIIVSSDRDVFNHAVLNQSIAISSGGFEKKLKLALSGGEDIEEDEEIVYNPMFSSKKRGNPRKLSKNERRNRAGLKKL
ncbi:MAG: NYN domain-containing protein [Nitrospirota bacterium]